MIQFGADFVLRFNSRVLVGHEGARAPHLRVVFF